MKLGLICYFPQLFDIEQTHRRHSETMNHALHAPSLQQPIACQLPKSTVAVLVRATFWLLCTSLSSISRFLNVGKVPWKATQARQNSSTLNTVKNHYIADSDMPWHRNAAIGLLALAVGAEAKALGFGGSQTAEALLVRVLTLERPQFRNVSQEINELLIYIWVVWAIAKKSAGSVQLHLAWISGRCGLETGRGPQMFRCTPACLDVDKVREAMQGNQIETMYIYIYFVLVLSWFFRRRQERSNYSRPWDPDTGRHHFWNVQLVQQFWAALEALDLCISEVLEGFGLPAEQTERNDEQQTLTCIGGHLSSSSKKIKDKLFETRVWFWSSWTCII